VNIDAQDVINQLGMRIAALEVDLAVARAQIKAHEDAGTSEA
jgi:hypothetical protein